MVDVSYERYIENSIRERYPFVGTPIRLYFRENERKAKDVSLKNKEPKPWEKYANRKKGKPKPEFTSEAKKSTRGGSTRGGSTRGGKSGSTRVKRGGSSSRGRGRS
jgi:uncharacterized membrane protein YgcG